MRRAIIAMFLCCACASQVGRATPAKNITTEVAVTATPEDYKKFVEALEAANFAEQFATINGFASQKKLNLTWEADFVIDVVGRRLTTKAIGAATAKEIFRIFELPKAVGVDFAKKSFEVFVAESDCEYASDLAYYFGLDAAYADRAILCEESGHAQAEKACIRPGTKEVQKRAIDNYVGGFIANSSSYAVVQAFFFGRFYSQGIEYSQMAEVVKACPLTERQASDLLSIGFIGNKLEFVRAVLDKPSFKKTSADYERFISLSINQYQCAQAAEVALQHKLSKKLIETIFLNKKCLGGNLKEVSLEILQSSLSASAEKVEWFFNLSLQAEEFSLAGRVAKLFKLERKFFDLAVSQGLKIRDYDEVLCMEPWGGDNPEIFRENILNGLLDKNEEWTIVRFVTDHDNVFSDRPKFFDYSSRNGWIARTFVHALFRDAYDLAADIAAKHSDNEFKKKGIGLAFEAALNGKNAKAANFIAVKHNLGLEARRRVAVLYMRLKVEEENKKKEIQLQRLCAENDWNIKICK